MSRTQIFLLVLCAGLLLFVSSCTMVARNEKINLEELNSALLIKGDENHAYRDPAAIYHDGVFYIYYTLVEIEENGKIYSYIALSKSRDLKTCTPPKIITPKGQHLNYCGPGNVIRYKGKWILCLSSYPRPGYVKEQIPRFGNSSSRVFTMQSDDLENWSEPELLKVKGDDVPREKMGRVIDPCFVEDKDEPGKWWCFYKQHGAQISWSYDLKKWHPFGGTSAGENACVVVKDDKYYLFHSHGFGFGVKVSDDLKNWKDWGEKITLGMNQWDWAEHNITAGFVLDMTKDKRVGKYLVFFSGEGPEEKWTFDNYASLGIAWSDDLKTWNWPKK